MTEFLSGFIVWFSASAAGPWEMLATILIAHRRHHADAAAGSRALHLFLHRHADGHGDVHRRQPFPGVIAMAEIVIQNLRKEFGDFTAVQSSSSFTIADGEFFMLLGPSGCGKTTTLADDRRAGAADLRRDLYRRRGTSSQHPGFASATLPSSSRCSRSIRT